ncbi:hypothetical protein [Nocardia noduli]|uniref:hypothetical protein n=1 Tax=Nocardia noduli TaxID=2815722 RepID=UPI001C239F15|nr:hypothetical protein [Nocardia noduli]
MADNPEVAPHSTPTRVPGDRSISLAWNVGNPSEGQQPQAELTAHYFKGSGYIARLKARTEGRDKGWITHHYADLMGRPGSVIDQLEATRYSAKNLAKFANNALAQVRRRFCDDDAEITAYFDPASEHHTY